MTDREHLRKILLRPAEYYGQEESKTRILDILERSDGAAAPLFSVRPGFSHRLAQAAVLKLNRSLEARSNEQESPIAAARIALRVVEISGNAIRSKRFGSDPAGQFDRIADQASMRGISASIGSFEITPTDLIAGLSPAEALIAASKAADGAVYAAKGQGRNQYVCISSRQV